MFDVLIKYFFLILCGIYLFPKLLNDRINTTQLLVSLPITFVATIIAYCFRVIYPPLNLIIIFIAILGYVLISYKKSYNLSIVVSVLSLSLSIIFYILTWFITIPITYVIFNSLQNTVILNSITASIYGISQILISSLFFKIKRFKKGIVTFENKLNNDLSVFLSIIALFLISTIYYKDNDYILDAIILFVVIIIFLAIYFYWKKHIANIYLVRLYLRNIKILENDLADQTRLNSELERHNEELSKIIHRDNKLIPAMQLAVEEILNCESPDEQKEKSRALLPQLKTMAEERTGILTKYEKDNKQLPATGIVSLDSSLKYLLNKAKERDISLNLSVTADMKNLTSIIEENDLNTLILDLGENAVIATSSADIRNILIVIGAENRSFCISIYDSGNQFEPRVIANLGIKRITTHKKTGGSGIGMMTTFELLKKYQASFVLNETLENESYCKQIKLCFDGQNECRILTERKEVLNIISKRKDIISN